MLKKDLVSLLREQLKKSPNHLKKSYELKLGHEIVMSLKGDDLDLWVEKDGHIEDVLADASGQFEKSVSSSKENIEKIHVYTTTSDNNKSVDYLEKLNEISLLINNVHAVSNDLLDEYIITLPNNVLSHEEQRKQELLKINKKIYNTFVPYMLYMSILLQNSN